MPFAPRSFGTGRPSLIKPSSAAMQQFRRGSPSVAPVPLRMPARPPVANRMQQYNTPPQMPPDRGGSFVPPPMPREMPTPPGGGGVFKQKPSREDAPQDPRIPPGGFGGYNPYRDGNYMGGQGSIPLPSGGEMSQPGGGGVMIMNPDGSQRPYGTPASGGGGFSKLDPRYTNPMSGGFVGPSRTGGNELVGHHGIGFGQDSPLARDNPQFDAPIGHHGIGFGQDSPLARDNPQFGMPPMPPEMNQLHRTQAFKRGGQVQAYAKGGRVMAKPVAKKVVKAAAPAKTASRGDGIAQRGRTKGTMR